MLRKMVYNGDRKFLILYPINELVVKGKEIIVNDKKTAEDLKELGFEEVAEGKDEIEKLEKKPNKKLKGEGE